MPRYHLTLTSGNVKTGPIPVSTTSPDSCPTNPPCPLKGAGCYAENGPLGLHWRKVGAGERGVNLETFCAALRKLPAGTPFRHNQAGDLPHNGDALDADACKRIAGASEHLKGWTYTHHLPTRRTLPTLRAVSRKLTVNLSANNPAEADRLARTGLPVVTILAADAPEKSRTPEGRRVVVCPAQTGRTESCATCLLCESRTRRVVVGFRAHGPRASQITTITATTKRGDSHAQR